MNLVRGLLLVEAAAFAAAALSHSGILIADPVAATAEAILAAVLLIGWLVTAWRPTWTRRTAVAVQAFALAGDLLGLTITVLAEPDRVPRHHLPRRRGRGPGGGDRARPSAAAMS